MPEQINFFGFDDNHGEMCRGAKRIMNHKFDDIISLDNLLMIWGKFLCGKRHKKDVLEFQLRLADNLLSLHNDLANRTYRHGKYFAFNISDPKARRIHKATVRDRIVHHLIYNTLYDYFDNSFIYDSYSCRKNKGSHRAMDRLKYFTGKVSNNHIKTCYVLKADVRKFFASIDHNILLNILRRRIVDVDLLWLVERVLASFNSSNVSVGLPLGNLTSQLFSNIYLNELDRYVKQELRIKYYIRYADDFVILSTDVNYLSDVLVRIDDFVQVNLNLSLHPSKVSIQTYNSGLDFLGWVHFSCHRQIRITTKRRIFRQMAGWPKPETINSYRGLLKHGNTYKIRKQLELNNWIFL